MLRLLDLTLTASPNPNRIPNRIPNPSPYPHQVRVLRLLDASGHCSEAVALLRNRPTTSRRAQAAVQALAEALARGTELD